MIRFLDLDNDPHALDVLWFLQAKSDLEDAPATDKGKQRGVLKRAASRLIRAFSDEANKARKLRNAAEAAKYNALAAVVKAIEASVLEQARQGAKR